MSLLLALNISRREGLSPLTVAQTSVCVLCHLKRRNMYTLLALRTEGSHEYSPGQYSLAAYSLACYAPPMSDAIKKRTNTALWLGLLITVLAVLSNLLYFSKVPAAALPWLNLTLPAIGLIFLLISVVRAFGQSQIYRGKIWGSIAAGLAALFLAASAWLFVQVGKRSSLRRSTASGPARTGFHVPDSNRAARRLAQLFTASPGMPQPKAVLLVFYRGYW